MFKKVAKIYKGLYCVCEFLGEGGGGGVSSLFPLSYQRLLNFAILRSYILVSFLQITFKLGNFTNLEVLFPTEAIDFSLTCACQKLKKKKKKTWKGLSRPNVDWIYYFVEHEETLVRF